MTDERHTVWIVDDDASIRWVLEKALGKAGLAVRSFADAESALQALQGEAPDAMITDVRMPGMDGFALLQEVHARHPQLPVIVITAHSDLDSAVTAYQGGAFEYLPKPFDIQEAISLTQRACAAAREREAGASRTVAQGSDILGESPAMQEVFRIIGRLSHSHINVLINGESGTGKELVAHALHKHSPRADGPFIALNMAAIPHDLLESELFGHEKGAFTGAHSMRQGRFEQAHGGTLFLDEIGDMPAELQTRLLRILSDGVFYRVGGHQPIKVDVRIIAATHQDLEERVRSGQFREDLFHRLNVIRAHSMRQGRFEQAHGGTLFLDEIGDMPAELQTRLLRILSDGVFYRVGGHQPIKVDVRIIAATHQDLEERVRSGQFREDLFHRLNVIRIHLPPLRERRQDIPLLTRHFLARAAAELEVAPKTVRPEVLEHLSNLSWPGNVRQLENTCRWLMVMAAGREIMLEDLPPDLLEERPGPQRAREESWQASLGRWAASALQRGETNLLDQALPEFERVLIETALAFAQGRRQDAARLLGWGRNTLTRKIKELALEETV